LDVDSDTVIFGSNAASNGSDIISQFTTGVDKLNLAALTTQTTTTAVNGAGNLTVTAGHVYFLNAAGATDASTVALSATALQGGATWTNASNGTVAFFVVSAGNGSAIYQYTEAGDVGITAGELTLMGTTVGTTITVGDLVFVANTAAAGGLAAAMAALATTEEASAISSVTIDVLANDNFKNTGKMITAINGSAITDGGAALTLAHGSVALKDGKLVFTPEAVGYNGMVSFKYTVTSGGINETAYVNVAVGIVPTGAAPLNTVPGGQYSLTASPTVVFSTANTNAITVADTDSEVLTTTLSVGSGTLTAVVAGGAAQITGNGTGSVIITGTAAEINFALNGLSFSRVAGNTSDISISVVTSDGSLVDSDAIAIGTGIVINLTPGADTYTSPAGNYIINAFGGANTITTGAGNNTVNAGDDADTITMGTGNATINAGGGANNVTTAATPFGTNIITTGDGNDIFAIAANAGGNTTIHAGGGNNIFTIGAGNSDLTGGSGIDTITTDAGNTIIHAGDGANVITTGAGLSIITTGSGADNITMGATAIGISTLNAGDGANIITTGIGKYAVTSGSGVDSITIGAGAGDSTIHAGAGNDTITSNGGKDIIAGGAGNDTMTGGLGADVFKWSLGETGADTIKDFNLVSVASGGDSLDLTDLLVDEHANATSLDAYLDFSANGSGTLITVNTNGQPSGGTGQTITLENFTFASLQAYAGGGGSDAAIIAKLLNDGNLITSP
jgi:Ca2+-binding RTX toxin-like protein